MIRMSMWRRVIRRRPGDHGGRPRRPGEPVHRGVSEAHTRGRTRPGWRLTLRRRGTSRPEGRRRSLQGDTAGSERSGRARPKVSRVPDLDVGEVLHDAGQVRSGRRPGHPQVALGEPLELPEQGSRETLQVLLQGRLDSSDMPHPAHAHRHRTTARGPDPLLTLGSAWCGEMTLSVRSVLRAALGEPAGGWTATLRRWDARGHGSPTRTVDCRARR